MKPSLVFKHAVTTLIGNKLKLPNGSIEIGSYLFKRKYVK